MKPSLTILTGASRGLGLALAQQLLAPGATLVCIARHSNTALAQQAAQTGAALEQWPLDLADGSSAAQQLAHWLAAQRPTPWHSATLINNAGVIPPLCPLRTSASSDIAQALRVGLEAPMLLCRAFLGATQDWPAPRRVLNISSGLGQRAMAAASAYCAAKAGMDHFTRCLALEEAQHPSGAKVCSLAPGVIDTDMQVQLRSANSSDFPDQGSFATMYTQGQLTSPVQAASRILAYLARADFGNKAVADVRKD